MSTQISKGLHVVRLTANPNPAYPNVGVEASGDSIAGKPYGIVDRADFLDAIRTELNVIIIDKADLPPVNADAHGRFFVVDGETFMGDGEPWPTRAALARTFALRDLALAEYLDANPPIDEAQVEHVASFLSNYGDGGVWEEIDTARAREIATALIRSGRIEVKS